TDFFFAPGQKLDIQIAAMDFRAVLVLFLCGEVENLGKNVAAFNFDHARRQGGEIRGTQKIKRLFYRQRQATWIWLCNMSEYHDPLLTETGFSPTRCRQP